MRAIRSRLTFANRAFLISLVIALTLGACGGGSKDGESQGGNGDQIAHAINESFTSGNPDKCTTVSTQQFLEQTYGLKGEAAVKVCERTAALGNAESVKTSNISVHSDTASVNVAVIGSELGGQTVVIRLVREGDQWKVDRVTRFVSFDREAWSSAEDTTLREVGVPPRVVNCVSAQFKRFSDGEVQRFYMGEPRPAQRILLQCSQKVHSRPLS